MRFRRWPRVSAYEDTPRKRAALARAQRTQRDRLPLLAPLIAERQPSADAEWRAAPHGGQRRSSATATAAPISGDAPVRGSLAMGTISARC